MSAWEKLKLLIWKNILLQKRHKWQTIFEIASPVIFALFLILVRCLAAPVSKPDVSYPAFLPTYFNISQFKIEDDDLGSIKREGTLAFSPENALTRKATEDAMATVAVDNLGVLSLLFDPDMLPQPIGFKNSKELKTALTQHNAMNKYLVGIQYDDIMKNATEWPNDITLTLRYPAVMRSPMLEHPLKASWRTNLLFPLFPRPGSREPDHAYGGTAPGYSPETFLAVQHAISQEIIKQKTGKSIDAKVYLRRLPQLAYHDDKLLVALERFVSMIIMLCFAYTFVNTVRVIAIEKELELKETMMIMGLSSWLHWLAWFIKQFSYLLISALLIVALFKIPFTATQTGERFAVLTFTPFSVVLFFMILFVIVSLAFSFMISVFFSKANTAASFMGLAWFATYSVYMLSQVLYEDITFRSKLLMSLFSNSAVGFAFQMVVVCEGSSKGLHWNQFFKPVSYHDDLQPCHIVYMLILDTVLYMLIALYVEKIRPGAYGVPLPWYFPFTKSFWRRPKLKANNQVETRENADQYTNALLKVIHDEEPKGTAGVRIQNLTKTFKKNKKAVDNLNLKMYENEITVLLGHNGAGKTTTISMLTGIIPPTSGTALINGYNIVTETDLARKSIGLCPQHNVLFPDLTVKEHIIFYSRLKGVEKTKIKEEVDHFMKLLNLENKGDVLSRHLSGGQKRRLSVGAAMCGSSRVVLLDEPTSGLDPVARRALWDLLQKEKKNRTIILTTHFMDEADVLGDRIAIMAGGKLQCVGTPYFLKRHYGLGYKLTVVKDEDCRVEKVTFFLTTYIPNIKENTNVGTELTYILPHEHIDKFPKMLKQLEEKKDSLHISSYGLSITSLEEVFMKAGAESSSENLQPKKNNYTGVRYSDSAVVPIIAHQQNVLDTDPIQKVRGFKLFRNHIIAMFLKLSYNTVRNKLIAFLQILSPVFNICISILIARTWKFMTDLPALTLSLKSGFRRTETLLSHEANLNLNSVEGKVMMAYKQYFLNSKHPGMSLTDLGTMDLGNYYTKLSKQDIARVQFENLIGATFGPENITAWFSNYGYHDSAISLAHVNDAILRSLLPGSSLKIVNHPLPYAIDSLVQVMVIGSSISFQFAFNIGFCMAFVSSFLVIFIVKERTTGAKLLQRVSGARPVVMWGCAFIWDWIWLLLIYICVVITLAAFQEKTLSTPEELGRVLMVLLVFSFPIIPIHYLASYFFEAPATGFAKMCFINIFTGCMPFMITEVLKLPEVGSPTYAIICDWIFSLMPIYCLSRSFREVSVSSVSLLACDALCHQFVTINNCSRQALCTRLNVTVCCIDDNPYMQWKEPGILRYLVAMAAVGLVAFIILFLKEYEVMNKLCYRTTNNPIPELPADEDGDVAAERLIIEAVPKADLKEFSLVCKDLTKYYKKFLAVNRLTFGVHKGECFGLLGVNGAGKTSTFRMLTGDSRISAGDAYVHGLPIKTRIQDVHANIGYCPQFDALLDNLTGRETLHIYCLLRGIPQRVGAARAQSLSEMLGFTKHYDKKVHECSGGTKRKLSTAVSLLGDSSLIFLDEPTTGMDPASKRSVWRSISSAVAGGRSVVLTSHSMEECEALCSRLTVMVNGTLSCLGPLQHLKSKFSQGYTLMVKCNPGPNREDIINVIDVFISERFPGARLMESYLGISSYYLMADMPWWQVFQIMQEGCRILPIEDYSVTQTTLEQVFLNFSRERE